MFLSVQRAERGHLRTCIKSRPLDCRRKIRPQSSIKKSRAALNNHPQPRTGSKETGKVSFFMSCLQPTAIKKEVLIHLNCGKMLHGSPLNVNCSKLHSATDSTHGIVIFRDTWGYFQTLMWQLKSAISHSKSDHLHLWSWQPKASYKDWKRSYYLLTNAL